MKFSWLSPGFLKIMLFLFSGACTQLHGVTSEKPMVLRCEMAGILGEWWRMEIFVFPFPVSKNWKVWNFNGPCCFMWLWNLGPLILREECRLRVLGTRMLTRILGPKKDEVQRGSRKLDKCMLHYLYLSQSINLVITHMSSGQGVQSFVDEVWIEENIWET
jgi:hypothetical protein